VSNLKVTLNPMQADTDDPNKIGEFRRCGAKTRAGPPCRTAAMPNGRCRMHGGTSPGAPKGNRNAWKHGLRSTEQGELRRLARFLRQQVAEHF
jgi:glucans biosynthesis protein